MSMLDSFLNKGFKGSKCKTLLKLTIPRIKLLRNRREMQIKQMRKDIAKLLEAGQEATARIRVEHIIREENMMAAQEIIELFCELISVRLPIIESQRECPLDLKEAISSICFAAPRCADLPELLQVQLAFVSKYGKEFVAAASELMPDCGVNRQLVELLSVRSPSAEKKLKLLKEIAVEHELDWDPAPSETELFKSHEDLLNGPMQFVSGSKVPLPKENTEILQSTSAHGTGEHSESEDDFDELEFPEVPKMPLRPSGGAEVAPPTPSAPHQESYLSSGTSVEREEKLFNQSSLDSENTFKAVDHEPPKSQFVPFIVPGPTHPAPPVEPPSLSSASAEEKPPADPWTSKQFVPFITEPGPPTEFPSKSSTSASVLESIQSSGLLRTKTDGNVDLNDVLAAAKAAAESAERAATAARAAASLVELRISELSENKGGTDRGNAEPGFLVGSADNPFHTGNSIRSTEMEKPQEYDNSPVNDDVDQWIEKNRTEDVSKDATDDVAGLETSPWDDNSFKQEFPYKQPQRIPSMDDDSDFTYPNLFSSPGGNVPSYDDSLPRHGSDMK
ncbi:hypothetical protein vseg_018746 [Gypsophila vaccaria]